MVDTVGMDPLVPPMYLIHVPDLYRVTEVLTLEKLQDLPVICPGNILVVIPQGNVSSVAIAAIHIVVVVVFQTRLHHLHQMLAPAQFHLMLVFGTQTKPPVFHLTVFFGSMLILILVVSVNIVAITATLIAVVVV
jgi:hypothetical protein